MIINNLIEKDWRISLLHDWCVWAFVTPNPFQTQSSRLTMACCHRDSRKYVMSLLPLDASRTKGILYLHFFLPLENDNRSQAPTSDNNESFHAGTTVKISQLPNLA